MIRLAIAVEGETEEEFVKTVLASYLRDRKIEPQPILPRRRGGNISVERLAPEMARLQWTFDFVTSLVDYYGFRDRRDEEGVEALEERIDAAIDREICRDWDRSRVFAYVQRHEFEGLLFSEVHTFERLLDVPPREMEELLSIRAAFETPEDIDDGRDTAPSKRIAGVLPSYRKKTYGPLLAQDTGLARIRTECPRFDAWVSRLESLGKTIPPPARGGGQ